MNVLIACEFSGVVRDAFAKKGHYAISVDLLPSETMGHHFVGDIEEYIANHWKGFDLMIAFPPCTYLTNAGSRWLYEGGRDRGKLDQERLVQVKEGARLFNFLLNAPIPRIAIENPVMHKYAKAIVERDYDQKVGMWEFGENEKRGTCLWLKNLPQLVPTNVLVKKEQKAGVHWASPSPDRWKVRSRTLPGIANAMVGQWGILGND